MLLIACGLVAPFDLIARRVPNALLIVLTLTQCCLLLLGRASVSFADAALGGIGGFLGLLPFYVFRLMGAGDVKFAALLGFLFGPIPLVITWLLASVVAGIHALVFYTVNANPALQLWSWRWTQTNFWRRLESLREGRRGIPYAAYLALGACVTFYVLSGKLT